ncbi:SWR1 complex subunit 2 [Camellia lanceoleosa]|uniref:SWR1 complex subunit 2 n=1 Tax=Camellia lanceoleosa TaxID=1840588 RepID=A0ACC0F7K3_9ERIC|nr:SWR1 complex subunit 2 [Camellia lanceoleosa]
MLGLLSVALLMVLLRSDFCCHVCWADFLGLPICLGTMDLNCLRSGAFDSIPSCFLLLRAECQLQHLTFCLLITEENDENYEEGEVMDVFDSDFDDDEPEPDEEVENEADDRFDFPKIMEV